MRKKRPDQPSSLPADQFQHWTVEQGRAYVAQVHAQDAVLHEAQKRNKYHNRKITFDGYTFDSLAEYKQYLIYKQQQEDGLIRNLRVHPTFPLIVNGIKICVYEGDFDFEEQGEEPGSWQYVLADVKGYKLTAEYRIKNKLLFALQGIKIREVWSKGKRPIRNSKRRHKQPKGEQS